MGLGSVSTVSLAAARLAAADAKKLLQQGIDPIDHRIAERKRLETPCFREAAAFYIDLHRHGWRNEKHVEQWKNTLATYAEPLIGNVPVDKISTEDILRVVTPIWRTKPETASRIRGRIQRILDWAESRGFREGTNPARWHGHLEFSLPSAKRSLRTRHHPALHWSKLPVFLEELSAQEGQAAIALRFTILTAARTGEVRGARWSEFDLESDVPIWTVPGDRMKTLREHRVPMSPQVVDLLEKSPRYSSGFVFEGRPGRQMSPNAMLAVLKRMGRTDITVHGFRSTFRDWCAEQTAFPREVAEAALAHVNRNLVEAAYLRTDLFLRRNALMKDWAKFASTRRQDTVVRLDGGQRGKNSVA